MSNQLNYKNYFIAAIISRILSAVLFYSSYSAGKINLFLFLNNDFGIVADVFFTLWTNLGDGAIWAVLLFVFLKYSKKNIPLLIAAFIICTVLVQVCKYIIVPNELRPVAAIQSTSLIHIVQFIEPHETASFPSGHTSAAFSFFLIGCFILLLFFIYFRLYLILPTFSAYSLISIIASYHYLISVCNDISV